MPDGYVYDSSIFALNSMNNLNADEKLVYLELYKLFNLVIDPTDLIFSDLSREIDDAVHNINFDKMENKISQHHLTIGFCFLDAKNFIKLYKRFCFYDKSNIPRYSYAESNDSRLLILRLARDVVFSLLVRLKLSIDKNSEDINDLNILKTDLYMEKTQEDGKSLIEYLFPSRSDYHDLETKIKKDVDDLASGIKKRINKSPYFSLSSNVEN